MERGIQGALLDRKDVSGPLPNPVPDGISMHGAPGNGLEDQEVEGASEEVAAGHADILAGNT
jgi:hypothetical protein